jgi:hypothetical protein
MQEPGAWGNEADDEMRKAWLAVGKGGGEAWL